MRSNYYRRKHLPNFVLLSCVVFFNLRVTSALLSLPNNVRAETEVLVTRSDTFQLYIVDEFIDRKGGNVQIKVTNSSDLSSSNSEQLLTSYYRIKESPSDKVRSDEFVVTFSHNDLLCSIGRTTSWQLKDLTNKLSVLLDSDEIDTEAVIKDRTAIGPLTFLQIAYANAAKFRLVEEGFDVVRLSQMYYFEAEIAVDLNHVAKFVCMIPVDNVLDREKIELGKTLLSEINTTVHPAIMALVMVDRTDSALMKMSADELLDWNNEEIDRLVIAYYLIQERSTSKHMGLKTGSLDEQNPFTLPAGAGCGSALRLQSMFYVEAEKFSGLFEAQDVGGQKYIAFDEPTRHLRVDSIGEYKMIFDCREKRITYIDDSTTLPIQAEPGDFSAALVAEEAADRAHCAQTYLTTNDWSTGVTETRTLDDVLGFGKHVGLMYLGTMVLKDGTHCLVFEREISMQQIPLLAKLNMRIVAPVNSRFFLTYYFVDELAIRTDDVFNDEFTYQSLWLKRMELTTKSSLLKYKTVNAQITFSEFTWSLESIAEDTRSRASRLMHPVRTFDTNECKSNNDQIKVEFVIQQTNTSDLDDGAVGLNAMDLNLIFLEKRTEPLEEAIMNFMVTRTRTGRSQINQLELVWPQTTPAVATIDESNDKQQFLLVRANMGRPLNYRHEKSLIGWVQSVERSENSDGKSLRWITTQTPISRLECSLKLAVRYGAERKLFMAWCPNNGCAYVREIASLDYIKRAPGVTKGPPLSDNYNMCEIYEQMKLLDSGMVLMDTVSTGHIERSLMQSRMKIDLDRATGATDPTRVKSNVFHGTVVKVATTKGLSLDSLGTLIRLGVCYTKDTSFADDAKQQFEIKLLELKFDKHHSLAHCHKACHIYPDCQTYTYLKTLRVCTLSNIPKSYVSGTGSAVRVKLKEESMCSMYEINSIRLFEASTVVSASSMEQLNNLQYYFMTSTLNGCANLCHSNELGSQSAVHCSAFRYFPINSVCAIVDKGSHLFKTHGYKVADQDCTAEHRASYFIKLLGQSDWSSINKWHLYNRDYEQYYTEVLSTKLLLPKDLSSNDSNQLSLVKQPTLFDLSKTNCLRECTLVYKKCIAVDYCFHPINGVPTQYCTMFHLNAPKSAGQEVMDSTAGDDQVSKGPLSDKEITHYLEGLSKDPNLTTNTHACTHYHLSTDYLALKRLIAAEAINSSDAPGELERATEELAKNDSKRSDDYIKSMKEFIVANSYSIGSGMGFFSGFFMLLIGLLAGVSLSVYGTEPVTHFARDQWSRLRWRRGRSESTVEFSAQ